MIRYWRSMVAIILCIMSLSGIAAAQKPQTANTLTLEDPARRPKATLADLSLLVGHWQGEFLGANAEELWLPAAGGSMVGLFRLHKEGKIVFYEFMILVEEEASVSMKLKHFHPDLKGWEAQDAMKTFRLVKATSEAIWFEGLTFRKQADGSLRGFIAISAKDGSVREESFLYRPITPR
ncbi:MAG: hypothetical protein IPO77_21690 [Acidobacteria bacterium]|nr:hypothetical protein [Acidobacteriota bacterium]